MISDMAIILVADTLIVWWKIHVFVPNQNSPSKFYAVRMYVVTGLMCVLTQ